MLATSSSIYSGMPEIEGTVDVGRGLLAWMAAHKNDGLIIHPGNQEGLKIHVDSDWGGMHSVCGECRSRTGIVIRYNGTPVYWKSALQKVVSTMFIPYPDTSVGQDEIATSSAYGELLAGADATTAALHMCYVAEELGVTIPRPLAIYTDATAAKSFIENTGGASTMKHIGIRSAWVAQVRDRHNFRFDKVAGFANEADTMTKLLEGSECNVYQEGLTYMGESPTEGRA